MANIKANIRKYTRTVITIGSRYGMLTVVAGPFRNAAKILEWECECDCGAVHRFSPWNLAKSRSRACGCMKGGLIEHGDARDGKAAVEYKCWSGMKRRCYDPASNGFQHYGGRGITICARWLNSYPNFLSDMGRKPSAEHSIDRINVNGNYEPSNCRWATKSVQAKNKRGVAQLTINGETHTFGEWSEITGVKRSTIFMRVKARHQPFESIRQSSRNL